MGPTAGARDMGLWPEDSRCGVACEAGCFTFGEATAKPYISVLCNLYDNYCKHIRLVIGLASCRLPAPSAIGYGVDKSQRESVLILDRNATPSDGCACGRKLIHDAGVVRENCFAQRKGLCAVIRVSTAASCAERSSRWGWICVEDERVGEDSARLSGRLQGAQAKCIKKTLYQCIQIEHNKIKISCWREALASNAESRGFIDRVSYYRLRFTFQLLMRAIAK